MRWSAAGFHVSALGNCCRREFADGSLGAGSGGALSFEEVGKTAANIRRMLVRRKFYFDVPDMKVWSEYLIQRDPWAAESKILVQRNTFGAPFTVGSAGPATSTSPDGPGTRFALF